ncbi:MAG: hypothetical protein EPN91_02050 [Salinibacterium sp.]|nr:MAG: hypothetical protein EPN91_02050 [Salinibacterium sp.]
MTASPFIKLMDRDDVMTIASSDSAARITCDMIQKPIGTGDNSTTVFDTPFLGALAVTVYVNVVLVESPNVVLSRGTGALGVDQLIFLTPPASGNTVYGIPDDAAIDTFVLDEMIDAVTAEVYGYLGRYQLDITNTQALAVCRQAAAVCLKVAFRVRRDLDLPGALKAQYAETIKTLRAFSSGAMPLPPGTDLPPASMVTDAGVIGSESSYFDNELDRHMRDRVSVWW